MARLLLIDGPAIAYRAHYGMAESGLATAQGKSTSATYGYATTLYKLLREEKPDYVCVALDTEKPTYRHDLFEDYKAGRPEMPDELAGQLGYIREVTGGLGIRTLEAEGYEADDIIGTLSREAGKRGMEVVIATGDKDMLQLVDANTRVIMLSGSGRGTSVMSEKSVESKYGIPPSLLPDFFGLMGDSVDNVPGVPGIGEKTARSLVLAHGSIESIYENIDAVEPARVRKLLEEHRDEAFSSRELVRINMQVPLESGLEDLKYHGVDAPRLTRIFKELEFRKLLRKMLPRETVPEHEVIVWGGGRPEVAAQGALRADGWAAVEVNLQPGPGTPGTLIGVAVSLEGGADYYFPLGHKEPVNVSQEDFAQAAGGLLASREVPKVAHDAKAALIALRNSGIDLVGIAFDTMLARYVLSPGSGANTLADIALDYLGQVWAGPSGKKGADLVTLADASSECSRRARAMLQVRGPLERDLEEAALTGLYREIEMPLVEVLAGMETRGVRVDIALLEELADRLDNDMSRYTREAFSLAGREFNLNSPRDIAKVLFEEIGLKPVKKTKTGYSTDLSVLTELAAEHELPRRILDYRQVAKLKSTYVDQLLKFAEPETGRIYAHFNQAVTATGRLSSSDPNLQNIPIRGEAGGDIRKAFIPSEPDWVFVAADYSQIELRILAHLCGDDNLVEAFRRGDDIHSQTAAFVFKVGPGEVSKEMRTIAKAVNFGVIYGMGAQALSKATGLPFKEARAFLDEHRRTYPGIYDFIGRVIEDATQTGYVETLLGRRRYLPNLKSDNISVRSASERMAVNTPVQGSAADLIKLAMLRVHRRISEEGLRGGMVIQVHDDILIDCPGEERERMVNILQREMGEAFELKVPLKVDVSWGANWYETS